MNGDWLDGVYKYKPIIYQKKTENEFFIRIFGLPTFSSEYCSCSCTVLTCLDDNTHTYSHNLPRSFCFTLILSQCSFLMMTIYKIECWKLNWTILQLNISFQFCFISERVDLDGCCVVCHSVASLIELIRVKQFKCICI